MAGPPWTRVYISPLSALKKSPMYLNCAGCWSMRWSLFSTAAMSSAHVSVPIRCGAKKGIRNNSHLGDGSLENIPQRTTGPIKPPVVTRAHKNPWQRARRHRSQSSRFNHQRPSSANFLCIREIPHPQDTYISTTGKFTDSGGVWRVLLVQGLHGHYHS